MITVAIERLSYKRLETARKVLDDVSFSLRKGEILCLLGPNGAGKTTLLQCLLGLLSPSAGQVWLLGADVSALSHSSRAKRISYVPQSAEVTFPFEARHMVLMGRTPHMGGRSDPTRLDREIAEAMLDRVGISHLAERPMSRLSGGERQLVLIARALAQDAPILVMDEPTSSLDLGNQGRVLRLARELADSGKTVVMTTHAPDHPFLLDAKVALLKNGALLGVGAPSDICTLRVMNSAYETSLIQLAKGAISNFSPSVG